MTVGALVFMFLACGLLFIGVARLTDRALVFTPLLLFGITEMESTWGSTLVEARATGDIYPALLTAGCFLAFIVGFLVASPNLGLRRDQAKAFRDAPMVDPFPAARYRRAVWIMAGALVALGTFQYQGLPPILHFLDALVSPGSNPGAVLSINVARELATKGYVFSMTAYRGQGVLRVVLERGWTYLSIFSIGTYFLTASRFRRRAPLQLPWQPMAVTLAGLIYVGGVGVRAPVVMLMVAVVVGLSLTYRFSKRLLVVAVGGIVLVILLVAPLGGEVSSRGAVQERALSMAGRIFLGNGQNNMLIMRSIKDGALSQQWGRLHVEQFLQAIPGASGITPFANRLNQLRGGQVASTTYASATYFGILYADFGAVGTLIGYGLMGAFVRYCHLWLFRRKKSVPRLALVGSITVVVSQLPLTGFIGVGVGILVVGVIHRVMNHSVLRGNLRGCPVARRN